jgi:N-glycosylase/DNA lyase
MNNFSFENKYFNIKQIFECGQFFNYKKENDSYIVRINNEDIKIKTIDDITTINKSKDFFDKYLKDFFDMNNNYEKIINEINKEFPKLQKYTDFGKGIRFLKQDFLEVAITFIISQNNNMKRIQKSIKLLIENYGENGNFPSLEILKTLSKNDFRNLGVGFRDEYLYNFVQNIDEIWIENMKILETKDVFNKLIKFKGIGPKVANCILLFGLQKRDVFPVDTHIKKIMQDLYFKEEEISEKEIEKFALEKFKEKSSYIQQYLFYWQINSK